MDKVKFLEESPGVRSWSRLQSLIFTLLFVVGAGWHIYLNGMAFELALLIGALAAVPKAFQKIVEMKYSAKE